MTDATGIETRLGQVRARIWDAAMRAGRQPESVRLIAVSKRQEAAAIRAAFGAGQRAFGESYVQEALDKQARLADLAIEWHFIGRIQTNKTRAIAAHFDWVHGLCDAGHARRLSSQRPTGTRPLQACIQVDLSGEPSKVGVDPAGLPDLLDACADLPGITVAGLMTLPAPAADWESQCRPFRVLRELRDRLATARRPLSCLSMGMSDDLEAAVAEGATLVRIGTAVFGPRSYNTGSAPGQGPD